MAAAPAGAVLRRLETRPLQDLTPYPGNARRGDVGTFQEPLTHPGVDGMVHDAVGVQVLDRAQISLTSSVAGSVMSVSTAGSARRR